jgi:hypothetical protein
LAIAPFMRWPDRLASRCCLSVTISHRRTSKNVDWLCSHFHTRPKTAPAT